MNLEYTTQKRELKKYYRKLNRCKSDSIDGYCVEGDNLIYQYGKAWAVKLELTPLLNQIETILNLTKVSDLDLIAYLDSGADDAGYKDSTSIDFEFTTIDDVIIMRLMNGNIFLTKKYSVRNILIKECTLVKLSEELCADNYCASELEIPVAPEVTALTALTDKYIICEMDGLTAEDHIDEVKVSLAGKTPWFDLEMEDNDFIYLNKEGLVPLKIPMSKVVKKYVPLVLDLEGTQKTGRLKNNPKKNLSVDSVERRGVNSKLFLRGNKVISTDIGRYLKLEDTRTGKCLCTSERGYILHVSGMLKGDCEICLKALLAELFSKSNLLFYECSLFDNESVQKYIEELASELCKNYEMEYNDVLTKLNYSNGKHSVIIDRFGMKIYREGKTVSVVSDLYHKGYSAEQIITLARAHCILNTLPSTVYLNTGEGESVFNKLLYDLSDLRYRKRKLQLLDK